MANEYKLTDKNLNNITVRRKQLISRFSVSSLKYVRILKQDILNKFRSYHKILNFKNSNLDFFKKPLKIRYDPKIKKYPLWFQFKLVKRPNLLANNFLYSSYKKTRKTRKFASIVSNQFFNIIPFLSLSKLNKNSNKHFLIGQSTDYSCSLRLHNFQRSKWRMLSLLQSLNILTCYSADYKRRDLKSFTGLPIYNKLGFFKWFFIQELESTSYYNQRFMSLFTHSLSYKIFGTKVNRNLFLIQKCLIFKRRRSMYAFHIVQNFVKRQTFLLLKKFDFLQKSQNVQNGFMWFHLNSLCPYLRLLMYNLKKIKKLGAYISPSTPLLLFYFNKFFNLINNYKFIIIDIITPLHIKEIYLLVKLKNSLLNAGLLQTSTIFQERIYLKLFNKRLLHLYVELKKKIIIELRRLRLLKLKKDLLLSKKELLQKELKFKLNLQKRMKLIDSLPKKIFVDFYEPYSSEIDKILEYKI